MINHVQYGLQLTAATGWRSEFAYVIAEYQSAHRIMLMRSQIGQTRRQNLAIAKLAELAFTRKCHRCAGIQQYHQVTVGFTQKTLDISAVSATVNIPVDKTRIIAFGIRSILGKLLTESEEGRAMQSHQKTIHCRTSNQLQIGQARQHFRLEQLVRT